jgi:Transposase domain (DUF772)
MFRKTTTTSQLNLFTSPESLFSGKSLKLYEDQSAWHHQFRKQVTMRIDESIFRPLYCENYGSPNASVSVLISMMVLKEAEGLSDQKLFENCRFNMLTRSAIGLTNADDPVPAVSTYYKFRKKVNDYAGSGNENLFDVVFSAITKSQCIEFEVSGKRIRMDSKLLGSNIAWLSRYELIHETLRLFYKQVKQQGKLDKPTEEILDNLLKLEGNKVVYTCTSDEVKTRLQELGELIYKILPMFSSCDATHYKTLQRVFNDQFKVGENKIAVALDNKEISAKSVQSPHETDCDFRDKDGNKIKGYVIDVAESCDDKGLNLIACADVRKATTPDVDFLQDDIKKAQEVLPDKIKAAHADGAFHSVDNQKFCKDNGIELHLHALQGATGRYQLNLLENGELSVMDTNTGQLIAATKFADKNNINNEKGYRYFTQKDIDTYQIRKHISETPIEILQKRNNVEATIFQLGYHYPNDKSRYRGHIKHQMWANIRCLWVNFVRILNYIKRLCLKSPFFAKYLEKYFFNNLCFVFVSFFMLILPYHLAHSENTNFSTVENL